MGLEFLRACDLQRLVAMVRRNRALGFAVAALRLVRLRAGGSRVAEFVLARWRWARLGAAGLPGSWKFAVRGRTAEWRCGRRRRLLRGWEARPIGLFRRGER